MPLKTVPTVKRALSKTKVARLKKLAQKNYSILAISKKLQLPQDTIHKLVTQHRIVIKPYTIANQARSGHYFDILTPKVTVTKKRSRKAGTRSGGPRLK